MSNKEYDIAIIGAGIVGVSLARLLSEYSDRIAIIEQSEDIALGATRANSGVVHGGYTAKHGSLKGELSIRGNRMYKHLAEELGFPYQQIGSFTLAFSEDDEAKLHKLIENGKNNGVKGLEILSAESVIKRIPEVNRNIQSALHCAETGILSSYEACIAMAESAVDKGAKLYLHNTVRAITRTGKGSFCIQTNFDTLYSHVVLNAAGIHADVIESYLGLSTLELQPRKGEYMILRRGSADALGLNSVVFQTPNNLGKGVLVTPTCWGNTMIGPNAEIISQKVDRSTSIETLRQVFTTAQRSIPKLKASEVIRTFAGVRSSSIHGDFIIAETTEQGFFNIAGIDSPGLTSAPAIAEKVCDLLKDGGYIRSKQASSTAQRSKRRPILVPKKLESVNKIADDINRTMGDPDRIVCRCEQVREKTILDALDRSIPITSMDGIKYRTRAGMGACQGQFCNERVYAYLKQHLEKSNRSDSTIIPAHKSSAQVLAEVRKFK